MFTFSGQACIQLFGRNSGCKGYERFKTNHPNLEKKLSCSCDRSARLQHSSFRVCSVAQLTLSCPPPYRVHLYSFTCHWKSGNANRGKTLHRSSDTLQRKKPLGNLKTGNCLIFQATGPTCTRPTEPV